jgi:hypothetical protein
LTIITVKGKLELGRDSNFICVLFYDSETSLVARERQEFKSEDILMHNKGKFRTFTQRRGSIYVDICA